MGYWFSLGLVLFEALTLWLTNRIKGVGLKRGAAIAGWISLFIGSSIIVSSGKVQYNQISFYFLSSTAGIAILAMLFIFFSRDNPQVYRSFLKGFFKVLLQIGWIIGILMPIALALLGL